MNLFQWEVGHIICLEMVTVSDLAEFGMIFLLGGLGVK
jgi:hypothetical protein